MASGPYKLEDKGSNAASCDKAYDFETKFHFGIFKYKTQADATWQQNEESKHGRWKKLAFPIHLLDLTLLQIFNYMGDFVDDARIHVPLYTNNYNY